MGVWWAALILVLGGLALLWLGARQQRRSGLPPGRVLYSDPKIIGEPERPLFDPDTLLTGKPDYLVCTPEGLIPVEVKSGQAPRSASPGSRAATGGVLSVGGGSRNATAPLWHDQI